MPILITLEISMTTTVTRAPEQKIAIVTGGSRGLGRNTVLNLAARGVDSVFTYRSNEAEAAEVVKQVAQSGQQAVALRLDTGNAADFDAFVSQVRDALATLGAERFDRQHLPRKLQPRGHQQDADHQADRRCRGPPRSGSRRR